jgi:hypothetical protein
MKPTSKLQLALALGLVLNLLSADVLAETRFRIASWNIANFHHVAGVELRENIGTRRTETTD